MNEDIKTVVANELKQRLPEMFPGLTKQAYEEIINETIASLPKNEEKFERAMEKAAITLGGMKGVLRGMQHVDDLQSGAPLFRDMMAPDFREAVKAISSVEKNQEDILHSAWQRAHQEEALQEGVTRRLNEEAHKAEQLRLSRSQQAGMLRKERETKRQFEVNTGLKKEDMALRRDQMAAQAAENAPKNIFTSNFIRGAGAGLGGAAIAAMAGGALLGLRGALSKATTNAMRPSFEQSLKIAMSGSDPASEILREKKDKVRAFAETIFNFAPHVASDPNLLKGVLAHVVQGESIDPQTIRSLMELEEKRKNIKTFKPSEISFK